MLTFYASWKLTVVVGYWYKTISFLVLRWVRSLIWISERYCVSTLDTRFHSSTYPKQLSVKQSPEVYDAVRVTSVGKRPCLTYKVLHGCYLWVFLNEFFFPEGETCLLMWLFLLQRCTRRIGCCFLRFNIEDDVWILGTKMDEELLSFYSVGPFFITAFTFSHFFSPIFFDIFHGHLMILGFWGLLRVLYMNQKVSCSHDLSNARKFQGGGFRKVLLDHVEFFRNLNGTKWFKFKKIEK